MTTEIPEGLSQYGGTMQHVHLTFLKIARLQEAQAAAEEQLYHRAASDYQAGVISVEDLLDLYLWAKPRSVEGFMYRWNRHMPREAGAQTIRNTARRLRRHRPEPDGTWRGPYPLDDSVSFPPTGTSVVYVLFDDRNIPCYVGSTNGFKGRVKSHGREGKRFIRWMAHPCSDREAAYDLEDRLLSQHKPYLNKRRGR